MAAAGALAGLLRVCELALLAPCGGVLHNAAEPVTLATALSTGAPLLPLAEDAVFRRRTAAFVPGTLRDLGESANARKPIVLRLPGNAAAARVLATPAAGTAGGPALPLREKAILGSSRATALRQRLALRGAAGRSLTKAAHAIAPVPAPVDPHHTAPVPDAVAAAAASAPSPPLRQLAVHGTGAGDTDIAELDLLALAQGLLATLVGHDVHPAAAEGHPAAAGHRARGPLRPLAPLPVAALSGAALLDVARRKLLLVALLAGQTAIAGRAGDVPSAGLLSAAAAAGATTPLAPFTPAAVRLAAEVVPVAFLGHAKAQLAALAISAAQAGDVSVAALLAGAAAHGAGAPHIPLRHRAVLRVAGLRVAVPSNLERRRARVAPGLRKALHLAVPS
mmetsp:Transcript_52327/g.125310  ORF Transcript_52327/g.125310 Transcript_52327/m.125310 type:complete len:393 (-) Transcript_52327:766-1944(-)